MNAAAAIEPTAIRQPGSLPAIVALLLGCLLGAVDGSIVSVALPSIARDLRITPAASVLIVTSYQLVTMMTIMPFASIGERIGMGRLFLGGIGVFVAAGACTFLAHDLPTLVVIRIVQALGAAAATSVTSALVRLTYPPARLGQGLALASMMATAGTAVGPTVGGFVLGFARWPWLFIIMAPLGLLVIALGRKRLPNATMTQTRFDMRGAAMCALMFGLLVTSLECFVQGARPIVYLPLMAVAAAFSLFFIRRELRQRRPVLPVDLLRMPKIGLPALAGFCGFLSTMLVNLLLPIRLQEYYHYTPAAAGALLACWAATLMVMGLVSGFLSDRVSPQLLTLIGITIATVGTVCLALVPAAPSRADFVWRLILTGSGYGLFFGTLTRMILAAAPLDRLSAAGSIGITLSGAGRTFGATLIAGLIAAGIGMRPACSLVGTALCLVALACSAIRVLDDRRDGAANG